MTKRRRLLLLCVLIFTVFSCKKFDDFNNIFDQDNFSGGQIDENAPPLQIFEPSYPNQISSPFTVRGSGTPNATLFVEFTDERGQILAEKNISILPTGNFVFDIEYSGSYAPKTRFSLKLQQSIRSNNDHGQYFDLYQASTAALSGSLNAPASTGSRIFIRAYTYVNLVHHVKEQVINVTSGQSVSGISYMLDLPSGSYYTIRAFRDDNNDGLSQISEAQAKADNVFIDQGSPATVNLLLTVSGDQNVHTNFSVRTVHSSLKEKSLGQYRSCYGYFLQIIADSHSSINYHNEVKIASTNEVINLHDDGGCQDGSISNYNSSYDNGYNDNEFSFGINQPTARYAGDYYLYTLNNSSGAVHVQKFHLPEVVKLSRNLNYTSPVLGQRVDTISPTISFQIGEYQKVTGCFNKIVKNSDSSIIQNSNLIGNGNNSTYFQIADDPLADKTSYKLQTTCYYRIGHGSSSPIIAVMPYLDFHFFTDTAGDSTLQLNVTVHDYSQTGGDYFIFADGGGPTNNLPESSMIRSDGTSNFTIDVLKDANKKYSLTMLKDYSSSQLKLLTWYFNRNNIDYGSLETSRNITMSIFKPMTLIGPLQDQDNVGTKPTFSWLSFQPGSYNGPYSYLLIYDDQNSSPSPVPIELVYNLPVTTNNFSMTTPPAQKIDVVNLVSSGAQQSITTLPAQSNQWGIIVVACAYGDTDCLGQTIAPDSPKQLYRKFESFFSYNP